MKEDRDVNLLRDLGNKLRNFRWKLAAALREKKLTQLVFGDMFGGHTPRQMTSYERGEVDPPASLLFRIWKSGNSVDRIFSEQDLEERGIEGAKRLFDESPFSKLKDMDESRVEKIFKEVSNAETFPRPSAKNSLAPTKKRARGTRKTGITKKR